MLSGTSLSELQKRFPERTFDVGISEGHAVTFAAGMAKDGLRPFVAIYSSFLQRAYDNIINDVAILGLPVVFCIDRAGIVGEDGVTHHGAFDLSYLRPIPGLTIAAPRNEHELRNLMAAAARATSPWVIRYPRGRGSLTDWHNDPQPVAVGRAERLLQGSRATILAIGPIIGEALKAARETGDVGVVDMRFLKPLDEAMLDEVLASGAPVVTLEDNSVIGGLGSAVAEYMARKGASNRLRAIGMPAGSFIAHGTVAELRNREKMDAAAIVGILNDLITTRK